MSQLQLKQETRQLKHWTDIFFQASTGYINATNLKGFGRWYGANDIKRLTNDTKGKHRQYLSINSFGVDKHTGIPRRLKVNLKQIRTIAIDLDQYTVNMSIENALDIVQALILDNMIPEPNLVSSSNGIQLFYKVDNGASPAMEWLRHYITCKFIERLAHIGADFKANDSTRLMRVPESINEKNNAVVQWEIWNDYAYTLDDLRQYTDLDKYKPPRAKTGKRPQVLKLEDIKHRNTLFFRTNHARIRDLELLFELRNGVFTHARNEFIYIYAYHYSLIYSSETIVIETVREIAENISSAADDNFRAKEWRATVSSAFKNAREFHEKYKQDGYKIIYTTDGIVRPMKTENVIKKLNINKDEQQELNYLYSADLKKVKEAERVRKYYGLKGTMEEYNADRQNRKKQLIQQIKHLKAQGMKQKDIANKINISVRHVSRLLKESKEAENK